MTPQEGIRIKVRTQKVQDEDGEGLVFQFLDPEGEETRMLMAQANPDDVDEAMQVLPSNPFGIIEQDRLERLRDQPLRPGGSKQRAALRAAFSIANRRVEKIRSSAISDGHYRATRRQIRSFRCCDDSHCCQSSHFRVPSSALRRPWPR
jgi:hypothetical protein